MLDDKKIIVVLPAFNAAKTLQATVEDLPDHVDEIIVVDDKSSDATIEVADELGLTYYAHRSNLGYGGNQKTCYDKALAAGADIVVMVHPDYQYSPKLVTAMSAMLTSGHFDIVLASRIIGDQQSRKRNMPWWRYYSNRFLTFMQNMLMQYKLSEYHTGFRAYTKEALLKIPYQNFSDDFIFDNELLVSAIESDLKIGELSCPTRYDADASSISFVRSVRYGVGVLYLSFRSRLKF